MLRVAIISVLIMFIFAVGFQLYSLFKTEKEMEAELSVVQGKADYFSKENAELESKIDFLSQSENLEKEIKSKFNYKNPGEKMIIVVP